MFTFIYHIYNIPKIISKLFNITFEMFLVKRYYILHKSFAYLQLVNIMILKKSVI